MREKTATPARQAINARAAIWDKNNTTQYRIKLNNNTDKDIIAHLESQTNRQGYLKRLIREDMARQQSAE